MKKSIDEVKNDVISFFYAVTGGRIGDRTLPIGKLTEEGRSFLSKLSGIEMKDHVDIVLNSSDMYHIYKNHYGLNEKDSGNNVPLTDNDIRNMTDVISSPDSVLFGIEKGSGRKLFFFFSKNHLGTYNLAEVYTDRKGNLTPKSFFNTKKGASQRVMAISSTLLPTSVTYSGASLSLDAKIPLFFESYNFLDEKISLARDFRVYDFSKQYGIPESIIKDYALSLRENRFDDASDSVCAIESYINAQFVKMDESSVNELFKSIRDELFYRFGDVDKERIKLLETDARQAIRDRITNSWQRTFTPDQVKVLNRYHQAVASDKPAGEVFKSLFEEVIKDPAIVSKPEQWRTDTLKELNDLAEGKAREEVQQLKK